MRRGQKASPVKVIRKDGTETTQPAYNKWELSAIVKRGELTRRQQKRRRRRSYQRREGSG